MPERIEPGPELYRELIEQVPVVAYVAAADEVPRVLYASRQSEDVLGRPPTAWNDPELIVTSIHPDDGERVLAEWASMVRSGEPLSIQYRYLHPDGRTRWLTHLARPSVDPSGTVRYIQGFIADVTAGRRAELELQESEARYRALVENIPAVIYEMGPDDERRTIYVSPHVEEILGYSRAEWLEQPDIWVELLHPDDREVELAAHDRHNETGEPWVRRYRLIADDGRVVWVRDHAVLVRARADAQPRWHGVMLDVTAQQEAEDQLRRANDELEFRVAARTAALTDATELMGIEIAERRRAEDEATRAEERLRVLVEHLPAVVYTWSLGETSEPEYTSPQIEDLLGFTSDEWNDTDLWIERLHPHDRDRVLAAAERCRTDGEQLNIEYRYLDRGGRVVWVLDRGTLIRRDDSGRPASFQGVMLPISTRKAAEAKAKEADARLRALTEHGPLITYLWHRREEGPQSPHTYLSPRIEHLLGYPLERWQTDVRFWRSILHPDDRVWASAVEDDLETTGRPWSFDYRLIAADGRVVWLHDEGHVLERDDNGEPSIFQGTMMDITERKETEERLRSSEALYRSLVEGIPAIPWTEHVDRASGRVVLTYIGPQVEALVGYRPDELIGEPGGFERMVIPEDREHVAATTSRSSETGEPWDVGYRVRARDGRVVPMRSVAVRTAAADGVETWHGITTVIPPSAAATGPTRSGRERAPAGTATDAPGSTPSRPPAGGSP